MNNEEPEVSTMIVNSFQIDEALQLKPLSLEELSEARTTADARIWIDLQGFEPSEFEDWLDKLQRLSPAANSRRCPRPPSRNRRMQVGSSRTLCRQVDDAESPIFAETETASVINTGAVYGHSLARSR